MGNSPTSVQPSKRRRELKNTNININIDDGTKRNKRTSATSTMEEDGGAPEQQRVPLSEMVSDCIKRWFQETLKEAKSGDVNMQVLVAQMYFCGYGVSRDANKGKIWISRASRVRSSAWKVGYKRPGYNASDSDSDESDDDS